MYRGSWQPPRLTQIDVIVLIVSLVTQATVRSWDYSTGNDGLSASLSLIERAFPLIVWGIALLFCALCLILGMVFRLHMLVWASHAALGAIYFTLLVGMNIAVFSIEPFPWDGIRGGSILLTPTLLHFVLALRTGPRPLEQEGAVYTETVVKGNE